MLGDDRSPLVREALRWFAVMRDDEVTDADREAFERWRSQSEEHAAAWERAASLWSAFRPVEAELVQSRRRKLNRRAFIGSSVGVLAIGSGSYWLYRSGRFADFRTAPGERRSFTLPDGSIVELGSRSALSVNYSEGQRRLVLHWGEACFTVAADQQRPFVVAAAGGETQALGTRFNIHTDDDLVTVTVTEHEVQVSLPGLKSERIEAGWQLAYASDRMLAPVEVDSLRIPPTISVSQGERIFVFVRQDLDFSAMYEDPVTEALREIRRERSLD